MWCKEEFDVLLSEYSENEVRDICYNLVRKIHDESVLRYGGQGTKEDFLKTAEWAIDCDKYNAKRYNWCIRCHGRGYTNVLKIGYRDDSTNQWVDAVVEKCVSCDGTGKYDLSKPKGEL